MTPTTFRIGVNLADVPTGHGGHTDLPVVFVFTIVDGSLTEIDGYWNSMMAMNQLGLAG